MGEHPPVSLAPTALENTQPLIGAGSPSTARNSADTNCFVSQDYPTDPNSKSSSQRPPSLHQDPPFRSLIQKTRSHDPSHRPNLLSIVLHLQQAVAGYFLSLSNLPLPPPASLSASLSLYAPRTPVKTPSPITAAGDFPEHHLASGTPSPSRPTEPPYPHHPRPTRTIKVESTPNTANHRPTRDSRSTLASSHSQSPVSLGGSHRTNRSPILSSLAPSQRVITERTRTGGALGPCTGSVTWPWPLGA